MSKEIPTTHELAALVDDEDYGGLIGYRWFSHKSRESASWYAVRFETIARGRRISIPMHRQIVNVPPGFQIDHINGNGLDNRKENLRICDYHQNQWNGKKQIRATSSKFKGVSWDSERKKWVAHITVNKKRVKIGRFTSEIDAARAYDAEARRLYGKFAKTNL